MNRLIKFWVGGLIVIGLVSLMAPQAGAAQKRARVLKSVQNPSFAPRWEPRDFLFIGPTDLANPFTVRFSARVTRPDGSTFTLPGFYYGDGKWMIRVSYDALGTWSFTTDSTQPELNGKTVSFECGPNTNPAVHGGLKVDPAHPHHFIYEDGTRHFLLGYECDWLWALDTFDPALKTVNPFLDKLVANGFNFVILNTYAHDCSWRKGKTGPDDFGPPPLYAWAGTNEAPDHSRFNLDYWKHYDLMMQALYERGITAHILLKVYNKSVKWPKIGSVEDDMFFRWVIARYAAFPNVVWDLSKEAHNEKSLEYKLGRFRFIRENDPYHRLVTIHDDDKAVEGGKYDELTDFRTDQQHSKFHETALRQRARKAWPIVNAEFGYEAGPKGLADKTYNVVQPIEEFVRRAWEVSLAGAYTAYYYTYTAWDVVRPEDTPPGYAIFKRMRDYFEKTKYWELEPADALVSAGYCLASRGKEYVVFQNQAAPFTLKIEGASGLLVAEWFEPLSGKTAPAGELKNGDNTLTPPAAWGPGMVALHAAAK